MSIRAGRRAVQVASMLSGDGAQAASAAHLIYVHGDRPGFRRVSRAGSTAYLDTRGRPIRATAVLSRIQSLAIPPAWTEVWICPDPRGHLQAWGRDSRARKQYRYHPRWRDVRDSAKYTRLLGFALALPRIRASVARDLRQPGLVRDKVLAAVVCLLEATMIRIGNQEYAKTNGSFGLTTLRRRHVEVTASTLRFEFIGKSRRHHTIDVTDRRLARIVRHCQELPGQELFKYVAPDGSHQIVDSDAVNAYLRKVAGEDFTAKDFRTWAGSVRALDLLIRQPRPESGRQAKAHVREVVIEVARQLGNTPAVCRKCYLHPAVVDAYQAGALQAGMAQSPVPVPRLSLAERQLLALLRRDAAKGRPLQHLKPSATDSGAGASRRAS